MDVVVAGVVVAVVVVAAAAVVVSLAAVDAVVVEREKGEEIIWSLLSFPLFRRFVFVCYLLELLPVVSVVLIDI